MKAAVQEVMALNPVVVNVTVHLWSYISIAPLQLSTVFKKCPYASLHLVQNEYTGESGVT